MAAGDVGLGADQAVFADAANPGNPAPVTFANGFVLSPYAEIGALGGNLKYPSRNLWHASPCGTATPNRNSARFGAAWPLSISS